jgi:hypothetical protein
MQDEQFCRRYFHETNLVTEKGPEMPVDNVQYLALLTPKWHNSVGYMFVS